MAADSEALAQGRRWLEQAEDELDAAEKLLDLEKYYLVCFLCQQVAEKALKSIYYARGAVSVRGHSVEALCRQAAEFDSGLSPLLEELSPLDAYYIPTRYPNSLPNSVPARVYRRPQAEDALKRARLVVEAARARLFASD